MTIQVYDSKMRKIIHIVRYELKLLIRSMTFWIMLVALGLWTFYINRISVVSIESSVLGVPVEVLVMLSLCTILVTISSFTREEREKAFDLVDHWPMSNRQFFAGKLLSSMFVGVVLYMFVLVIEILVSVRIPSDYGLGFGLCLIHVTSLVLFPISLAVLFSARLNNRLIVLCSIGVWIVIFLAIPEAGGFEKGYEWLDILDPLIRGVDVRLPGTLLPLLLHRLFYLVLSMSILASSCKYSRRTRQYWDKNMAIWSLAFLGVALGIVGSYFYVWNSRYDLANGNTLALLQSSEKVSESQELLENSLSIEEYDLDIEIVGKQHEIVAKAVITMRNSLGKPIRHFFMSLRDTFGIVGCRFLTILKLIMNALDISYLCVSMLHFVMVKQFLL